MRQVGLVDHIDTRCAALGLSGWYGEINAPVERLTVARPLALARAR